MFIIHLAEDIDLDDVPAISAALENCCGDLGVMVDHVQYKEETRAMPKFACGDHVRYCGSRGPLLPSITAAAPIGPRGTVVYVEPAPGEAFFYHVEWDGTDYTRFTPSVYQAEQLKGA